MLDSKVGITLLARTSNAFNTCLSSLNASIASLGVSNDSSFESKSISSLSMMFDPLLGCGGCLLCFVELFGMTIVVLPYSNTMRTVQVV